MAQDNEEDEDLNDLLENSENADDQKGFLEDDDGMDYKNSKEIGKFFDSYNWKNIVCNRIIH